MKAIAVLPLSFVVATVLSVAFLVSVIDIAGKKQLFDSNNHLKLHKERVSPLGGIAIFASFWITFSLFLGEGLSAKYGILMAGAFFLFLSGVKDDLMNLPALRRLLLQIGVATLLYLGGVQVVVIPGLGIELPWVASYLFSIVLMGAIVNAYNFIDGINGLASGLAIIGSAVFALLFFQLGAMAEAKLASALAGSLLGFWFFNFGKAKIFMGDSGSTFVGILLTYLVISFLQLPAILSAEPSISPWAAFAVVSIPLADLVKVVLVRMYRGVSPMRGDHTHIHHVFGGLGLGPRSICLVLYSWALSGISFSIFLMPKDLYIAGLLLLLTAGLPYLGAVLAEKILKAKKQSTSIGASGTRQLD